MGSRQWEIKIYNNLYTQREPQFDNSQRRSSFNTSFLQLTLGSAANVNVGFDVLYRSNVTQDRGTASPFRVFEFMRGQEANRVMGNDFETSFQHGLTHLGPRVRVKPLPNQRFTLQQAVYAPTGQLNEAWIVNTDLFYEYLYRGRYMIFGDLGLWYPIGGDPFPYLRVFAGTLLWQRLGPFAMVNLPYELGAGAKVFITPKLELEVMYTYWLPLAFLVEDRRPRSINFGVRVTNFNNF